MYEFFIISYTEHFSYKFHPVFMDKAINETFMELASLSA